jgi:hypothetical protein
MSASVFQTFRMIWIDGVLVEEGEIQRRDICVNFDLSVPQASQDLRRYQQMHVGRIYYDRSDKIYRIVEGTKPFFSRLAIINAFELISYIQKVRTPSDSDQLGRSDDDLPPEPQGSAFFD